MSETQEPASKLDRFLNQIEPDFDGPLHGFASAEEALKTLVYMGAALRIDDPYEVELPIEWMGSCWGVREPQLVFMIQMMITDAVKSVE